MDASQLTSVSSVMDHPAAMSAADVAAHTAASYVRPVVTSTPEQLRNDARQWRADAERLDGEGQTGHARACRAQAAICDKQADAVRGW